MLGGRSTRLIAKSMVEPRQYVALARMVSRYPAFPQVGKRYFIGGGSYPYACRVRTPTGTVAAMTYSHHDVFTVHEIFGREDYRAGAELRVAVDVGSNVGISALYFLTRNRTSRCYLYEPVPRNVERLRSNLAGYETRYRLDEVAVAAGSGMVDFTVEPTGRYGGIGVPGTERIQVPCRSIEDVLDEVLEREPLIDLLKLDTEGAELETLRAIPSRQLSRIGTIYYETTSPDNPDPQRFAMQFRCETCRLAARDPRASSARPPRTSAQRPCPK